MRSIGIWLMMLVVLMVIVTEADAGKTKTKIKIKIVYKKKTNTRSGRSIEDTLTLPCEVSEYDTDKDGAVSKKEWEDYVAKFNPGLLNSPEYVDLIIKKLDVNGDGVLQIQELFVDNEYKKDCI
ncbi:uncharacterized protein LOC110451132 [Mizuhopecten yessoensis]|uniref:uncharacterized protein LOC110451132 n=1 Tax=Mizuhopecten yessoensis TaxID=6573 RepID=UPI000B45EBE0|nr:uncharacterized protein LOC110451132 [Mizuhopecten yessoensis]